MAQAAIQDIEPNPTQQNDKLYELDQPIEGLSATLSGLKGITAQLLRMQVLVEQKLIQDTENLWPEPDDN